MSALPAELTLDPVRQIDGFVHACLVDATSGMILSSVEEQDGLRLPVTAAGATDVINVLSLMTGELAADRDVEDVICTCQVSIGMLFAQARAVMKEYDAAG